MTRLILYLYYYSRYTSTIIIIIVNILLGDMDSLVLTISLSSSNYLIEKDVLLYNESNLIADIGGYLGLLLGVSILSIYEMFTNFIKNVSFSRAK